MKNSLMVKLSSCSEMVLEQGQFDSICGKTSFLKRQKSLQNVAFRLAQDRFLTIF